MLMLGLLTVLLGPIRPRILLLDDIEHGLHPLAQKQLVEAIGQVLQNIPTCKCCPRLIRRTCLNQLQPEQIRLMASAMTETRSAVGSEDTRVREVEGRDGPWRTVELVRREMDRGGSHGKVSNRIRGYHEAPADFETATELADRVLVARVEWLEETRSMHQWIGCGIARLPLSWKSSPAWRWISESVRGHFDGAPLSSNARAARRAILDLRYIFADLAGVLLIRDQDDQPERRAGLEQARRQENGRLPVVIGLAVVERECWVIAGFDPQDDVEGERLAAERQMLGFDPRVRSHERTACKNDRALRSPKRSLTALVGDDRERQRKCWMTTSLEVLVVRGRENGLKDYLKEIDDHLVPLITGQTTG